MNFSFSICTLKVPVELLRFNDEISYRRKQSYMLIADISQDRCVKLPRGYTTDTQLQVTHCYRKND
jgi:hypothetical protein